MPKTARPTVASARVEPYYTAMWSGAASAPSKQNVRVSSRAQGIRSSKKRTIKPAVLKTSDVPSEKDAPPVLQIRDSIKAGGDNSANKTLASPADECTTKPGQDVTDRGSQNIEIGAAKSNDACSSVDAQSNGCQRGQYLTLTFSRRVAGSENPPECSLSDQSYVGTLTFRPGPTSLSWNNAK